MFSHFKSQGLEAGFEEISQEHATDKWRGQDPGPSSLAPEATLLVTTRMGSDEEAGLLYGDRKGFGF